MSSGLSSLTRLISCDPNLRQLLASIQKGHDNYWLVGGCLRDSLLDLPLVDIDICSSSDPTPLAQEWAAAVGAKWFWLDAKRRQSRVLVTQGISVDFTPLRAPSISEDLQLRDFTINALALSLSESIPHSTLLDPLCGVDQLRNRELQSCSDQSFSDDPLRILKGIRHAVMLDFTLTATTLKQIKVFAPLLVDSAGERIREELDKIFSAKAVIRGVELLIDNNILVVLLGAAGWGWERGTAVNEIEKLKMNIEKKGLINKIDMEKSGHLSLSALFILARLIKLYAPTGLSRLLHHRLRFSRYQQRLVEALQVEPEPEWLVLATTLEGERRQALLVEQFEPFAVEKLLNWGVYRNYFALERVRQLRCSFMIEQQLGRIPDLLNGKLLSEYLGDSQSKQIGYWHKKLKLAEIRGEFVTATEAESWFKKKLSFDNK